MTNMATRTLDLHYPVMELLMRHGVAPKTAKYVSMNELAHWPLDDLRKTIATIKRPARTYRPFEHAEDFIARREKLDDSTHMENKKSEASSDLGNYFRSAWPSLYRRIDVWLRAPRELVVESVTEGAALCVNENGDFSLRTEGYIAISHAWCEGLQQDEVEYGVLKSKVDLIFLSLRRQCIKTEWIWLDVLAVPKSATVSTSVEDDILKVKIINTLADVYGNADGIAVFDALAWQLESNDLLCVAVTLVCGVWASRLWTFQEIKLAKKAFIITSGPNGAKAPEWSEIVAFLANAKIEQHDLFHKLWLFYIVLHDKSRLSIRDLVQECQTRETGNRVDYARAFFPTLGLKWKQGMTYEQGMQEIFFSQRWEATRTMFYYGCPRMSTRPGWMPNSLVGLEGEVSHGLENESRGIRGAIFVAQISAIGHRFQRLGKWALNCVIAGTDVQCVVHESERDTITSDIDTALAQGTLYLLRPTGFIDKEPRKYAPVGLFAIRALVNEQDGFECGILCAVLIMSPNPFLLQETEVLIRHGSLSDSLDLENTLLYNWYTEEETSVPAGDRLRPGEQEIHRAVRNNNLASVRALIEHGADPHALDGTGLSALHIAACRGYEDILKFLTSCPGIDLNLPSGRHNKDPPLHLAADCNQSSIIQLLVASGIDVDFRREGGYTALMSASYEGSLRAVETLLDLGADPNANGHGTVRETALKLTCGRTHPAEGRLFLARALLDRGANPNGIVKNNGEVQMQNTTEKSKDRETEPYIWPALSEAIQWSHPGVIKLLLDRGANPNNLNMGASFLPLRIAVKENRTDVVLMLLEHGATCDIRFDDGSNILHYAARCTDFEIVHMILNKLDDKTKMALLDTKFGESRETPIDIAGKLGTKLVHKMLTESYREAQKREPVS